LNRDHVANVKELDFFLGAGHASVMASALCVVDPDYLLHLGQQAERELVAQIVIVPARILCQETADVVVRNSRRLSFSDCIQCLFLVGRRSCSVSLSIEIDGDWVGLVSRPRRRQPVVVTWRACLGWLVYALMASVG
jgi:hypothetical protein